MLKKRLPTIAIVITGASSGLGEALATIYAGSGTTLWLSGRNAVRLEAVADKCRDAGSTVRSEIVDVADRAAMGHWIATIEAESVPDLVIANAGISGAPNDENQIHNIFAVNLNGVLNTVLPILPAMKRRGAGQIAIMSSMAGFRGLPSAPAYAASKAAVLAYGDGLRGELKDTGVAVSVICPGFVKSRITDVNTFPMPFLMGAEQAANIIKRGLAQNRPRIVFPWRMRTIMWLLSAIPAKIADAVLIQTPRKF